MTGTFGLQTYVERERLLLAPYAMHSADSQGRPWPESEHPYRGPFQRDRDRVLHSAAYRRLAGKMQVFTGEMGDYHRTRMTHTQEVASIARTVGRALRLNEDLIEALALFHDIGHPPFGHCGEDALDACLADEGGFSHNAYALTLAEQLEKRHATTPGLNLTFEVLEGQRARVDKSARPMLLESQVVDAADSITYDAHDTDDAVKLGLVTLDDLRSSSLIRETMERVGRKYASLDAVTLRKAVVHELIDWQVGDLLTATAEQMETHRFSSHKEILEADFRIQPSAAVGTMKSELEAFLFERVYRHPWLLRVRNDAAQRICQLFDALRQDPQRMTGKYRRRAEEVGLNRSIGDYIAGMTDRYCSQQYQQLVAKSS